MTTLAWTLAHFLWQGTLVALAAAVFLRFGPRGATPRYVAGVVALGVMLVTPLATYVVLLRVGSGPAVVAWSPRTVIDVVPSPSRQGSDSGPAGFLAAEPPRWTPLVPIVVSFWALGVLVLSMRLIGGWLVARRLASKVVAPVGPEILAVAARVSTHLGVRRAVRVLESSACAVPVVIGWVRPVVLLPVAALSGLSPVQIEALLAHELAHVRRHDYLVNLLQAVVETLLFYHPGVWWVSRQVRIEREHCCDDMAVSVCDRVDYASALSALATMTTTPSLALAATDGSLLSRVRRLLAPSAGPRSTSSLWCGVVTAVAVVMLIPVATGAVTMRPVVSERLVATDEGGQSLRAVELLDASRTPDVAPTATARTRQMTRPTVSQSEAVPVAGQAAETAQLLQQQRLQELERRLQEVHGERQAAEDARHSEIFQAKEAALTSHLERLRAAHEEAKTRFDTGLASAGEAGDLQAMMGTVDEELRTLRLQERARQTASQLARKEATLQAEYATLRVQYETLLAQRRQAQLDGYVNQAAHLPGRSSVIMVSLDRLRTSFTPAMQPYTQGEPSLHFTVPDARTSDGARIVRGRFIGWQEGDATRVMVLVSLPRDGETNADATDTSRWVERGAGTYLIRFGELLELKDLEAFGIRNVSISSVVPVP